MQLSSWVPGIFKDVHATNNVWATSINGKNETECVSTHMECGLPLPLEAVRALPIVQCLNLRRYLIQVASVCNKAICLCYCTILMAEGTFIYLTYKNRICSPKEVPQLVTLTSNYVYCDSAASIIKRGFYCMHFNLTWRYLGKKKFSKCLLFSVCFEHLLNSWVLFTDRLW